MSLYHPQYGGYYFEVNKNWIYNRPKNRLPTFDVSTNFHLNFTSLTDIFLRPRTPAPKKACDIKLKQHVYKEYSSFSLLFTQNFAFLFWMNAPLSNIPMYYYEKKRIKRIFAIIPNWTIDMFLSYKCIFLPKYMATFTQTKKRERSLLLFCDSARNLCRVSLWSRSFRIDT